MNIYVPLTTAAIAAQSIQNYLQGINERILLNVTNIAELCIPLLTAFVMGMQFGLKGIMASIAIGKFILVIFVADWQKDFALNTV